MVMRSERGRGTGQCSGSHRAKQAWNACDLSPEEAYMGGTSSAKRIPPVKTHQLGSEPRYPLNLPMIMAENRQLLTQLSWRKLPNPCFSVRTTHRATRSTGVHIYQKYAELYNDRSWVGCAWRPILYRCDRIRRGSYESSVLAHCLLYLAYSPTPLLELAPGELLMMDNFTLAESMSAIEVRRCCFI
jgi:hypothetical protein